MKVAGRELVEGAKPVIAIFGRPAAGKTFLRLRLASHLGVPSYDIADQGELKTGRWVRLLDRLAAEPSRCIIESCISPAPYREMLRVRGAIVIKVADSAERAKRLRQRSLSGGEVRRLMSMRAELPWPASAIWRGGSEYRPERLEGLAQALEGKERTQCTTAPVF